MRLNIYIIFLLILQVVIKAETIYTDNGANFGIINPLETRNLRGNFAIAGNTVMCLTNNTTGFGGTCIDASASMLTSNMRVSRYIDIDNNNRTWNSSSSYIVLPNSYENESNGKSIAWAGLFWLGRITTSDLPLRYPVLNGNTITYVNRQNSNTRINLQNTTANHILLKVNNGNYINVDANRTIGSGSTTNSWGISYSSYADVTKILQNAKLKKGKNTFTVANLLTCEGRERSPGVYGGWSLVVIYKEDLTGLVRNVSSFYGFTTIGSNTQVSISGLRLPKYGNVSSKAALFSGEGEYLYGRNPNNNSVDWIKISDRSNTGFKYMPDANGNPLPIGTMVGNRDNIFDAHLSGVKRDNISGKFNDLQVNNDGVDVDIFNLSKVMKNYRDNNQLINTVYLRMFSNNDYITPTMITFATQLYIPKVCYDYSVKIGDYITVPKNELDERNITVSRISNKPLQLKLLIRSKEADFDLLESSLSATFKPDNVFKYESNKSKYSPPNTVAFLHATDVDPTKGAIAVGRDINSSGGIIGSKETTYGKLYYSFEKDKFSGKFEVNLDAKISFDGVNRVPFTLSTGVDKNSIFYIKRCATNPIYDPVYGMLNIERGNSKFSQQKATRYALYTQVVGLPYQISLASYEKGADGKYNTPHKLDAVVEVEVVDAGTFDNNASSGFDSICNNPDSYNGGNFIDMKNKKRVKYTIKKSKNTVALRNAAFRAWIFTVKDGNKTRKLATYPPRQGEPNDLYFKKLYDINYKNGEDLNSSYCKDKCANANANDQNLTCYQCIRSHFGTPICSRDNFSIRPQSYEIKVSDTNEDEAENNKTVTDGNLAAGYNYKLDATATSHENNKSAIGYYFITNPSKGRISSANSNNGASCADKSNKNLNLIILNASTILMDINSSSNVLNIDNAGKYSIHLEDEDWTKVDQVGYIYRPFPNNIDCDFNKTEVKAAELNARRGCLTATGRVAADTLPDKPVVMHPYKFDITNVTAAPNPNSSAKYVYLSDINKSWQYNHYNSGDNHLMALRIGGGVKAVGKDGTVLTNYTKGCVAKDTKVSISYTHDKQSGFNNALITTKWTTLPMFYYIYDNGIDGNNKPKVDVNSSVMSNGNFAQDFNKSYFKDNKNGVGIYSQYVNFKREERNPVNPFIFTTKEFNITSPNDKLYAHLSSNYIPKGHKDINTSVTFYYAKAQPKEKEYSTYKNTINTPVGIAIYCDKKIDIICANRYDINVTYGMIFKEPFWYIATEHNASKGDGKLILSLKKDNMSGTPINVVGFHPNGSVDNFINGIKSDINVTNQNIPNIQYPYTACIYIYGTALNIWPYLVYDRNKCLYKVTFHNVGGAWSGEGKTGNVVEYNNSGLKNNKIGW